MWKKIKTYYHTVRYLKKSQIRYLVKNRIQRKPALTKGKAPAFGTLSLWMERLELHPDYQKRFSVEEILNGEITLLHEKESIGNENWKNPEKSHLWNFNLQYLEFLIPLAGAYRESKATSYYECFRWYCCKWMEDNEKGTGDAWHPYTISLRLTNLWICIDGFGAILSEDREFFEKLQDSMYAQYLHLQNKLERHLLGNHYFENLKAVMLGALCFKEPSIYEQYKDLFRREIEEQILPDGVHYERSLMYHKIILEDLMRVAKAISQADSIFYTELLTWIQKMADAMYSLEEGMGRTPLFNDAGDNVARSMISLLAALREEFFILPTPKRAFEKAGYYCIWNKNKKLLFDAGEIAPDYMPGHGHCDALSFELSYQGRPLFVNSGTGQYQGEHRAYFRSTKAHNTVVMDGEEQSQCWGEHRVAKRISKVSGACGETWVEGHLETCMGKSQGRRMEFQEDVLEIWDKTTGQAQAYFHLALEYQYCETEDGIVVQDKEGKHICLIKGMPNDRMQIHKDGELCLYAPEFGKIEQIQVLEIAWDSMDSEHMIQMRF